MPLPDCSVDAGRVHAQLRRNKRSIDHYFLSAFLLQFDRCGQALVARQWIDRVGLVLTTAVQVLRGELDAVLLLEVRGA
jgi:hypothetical protein